MIDQGRPEPTLIVELGVAEAHAILVALGHANLPPLDAVENEDWGRDWLLAQVAGLPPATLLTLNLARDPAWDQDRHDADNSA